MRFGVFDHLDHPGGDLADLYAMRLALIGDYDRAGFHAYHLAEHHGTDLGAAPSPALFLAAAAQHSTRLRLGAMVFCLPLYHPVRLLEEICMLDQMSGGRLELGVGRGISPIEGDFFGVDAADAREIYREDLALILEGLKGGELDFEGARRRVAGMPMVLTPRQKPHPPLWFGVGVPESAVFPAEQGINILSNQTTARVREVTDAYRAAWTAAGRAAADLPLLGMTRHIVVAEDGEEARAIARRAYQPWREAFLRLWKRHGLVPPNVSLPEDFDQLMALGQGIAGTADEVAAEIARQEGEADVNYFLCRFAFGDITLAEAQLSVGLFRARMM